MGIKDFFLIFKEDFSEKLSSINGQDFQPPKEVFYTKNYSLDINGDEFYPDKKIDKQYLIDLIELNKEKIIYRKTDRWQKEEEHRIVFKLNTKNGDKLESSLFNITLDCISEVIFGAAMSLKNKLLIKKLCENTDIAFNQAMIVRDAKGADCKLGKVILWKVPHVISWGHIENWIENPLFLDEQGLDGINNEIEIEELNKLPYPPESLNLRDF